MCCRTCACTGRCPVLPTGPFTANTTQPLRTYLLLLERPEQLGGPQIKCVLLDLPGWFWRVEVITSWLEQIRELSLSVVQARFIKQDISLVFHENMLLVRENYLGLNPSTFGMAVLTCVSLIIPRRVLDAREEATCPGSQLPFPWLWPWQPSRYPGS